MFTKKFAFFVFLLLFLDLYCEELFVSLPRYVEFWSDDKEIYITNIQPPYRAYNHYPVFLIGKQYPINHFIENDEEQPGLITRFKKPGADMTKFFVSKGWPAEHTYILDKSFARLESLYKGYFKDKAAGESSPCVIS